MSARRGYFSIAWTISQLMAASRYISDKDVSGYRCDRCFEIPAILELSYIDNRNYDA